MPHNNIFKFSHFLLILASTLYFKAVLPRLDVVCCLAVIGRVTMMASREVFEAGARQVTASAVLVSRSVSDF